MDAGALTALVTGGSRGLGREICLALGGAGYRVAVNFLNSEAEADELLKKLPGGSFCVRADVADSEAVGRMARGVEQRFGALNVLVNNAAINRDALMVRQGPEEWDRIMGVNLGGCFYLIRALAPLMARTGGGHIVNISSVSALTGRAGQSAYSASKAAVLGLTRSAAAELAADGIRVNAVVPGYMPTDMGLASGRAARAAINGSALGKLTEASQVAGFIAWLIGSRYITGQVLRADARL